MAFDPDSYLTGKKQAGGGFDPVAYLSNKPQNSTREAIFNYGIRPIIEGGAMTIGALGGTALTGGNPLGGAAVATATYPIARRATRGLGEALGIPQDSNPRNLMDSAREFGEGAAMEAGGRALPAISRSISKLPYSQVGEAFSGTPASNLRRAFKKGLSTYVAKPLSEASENYGAQEARVISQYMSPKVQADMLTNANGVAAKKLNEVARRWLSGERISTADALQAKQAVNTLFPDDTAKKAVLRGKMSQFGDEMNKIIAAQDPAMKQAVDDYADSSLRSQLLQPIRVNKRNPNQPSKLGIMIGAETLADAPTSGFDKAIRFFTLQSPAFMGFVSAMSGQLNKIIPKLSKESQEALARGLFSAFSAQNGTQR